MDDRKEKMIIILVDFVMLLIVVAAVYLLLKNPGSSWKNVYSVVIILAIPTIFYVTASKVANDKYQFQDIIDEEDEKVLQESSEKNLEEISGEIPNKELEDMTEHK